MSTRSFGSLGAASAVGITAGAAATALILRRLLLRIDTRAAKAPCKRES